MPTRKPLVIVTRKLPDVVETRMRELFNTRLNVDDHPMSQAELVAAAKEAEILVPTVTDRIDKAVLNQAGAKLIGPENAWIGWSPIWMLGHRITGKRLGIVGMGRIGQALARRAKSFGLQIHYHNRKPG